MMADLVSGLKRLFGVKDGETVRREVEQEPTMQRAQRSIIRAEGVLAELEALERRKRRR